MNLSIRSKLIALGLLAVLALAVSSYMSYMSGKELQALNGQSSVTSSNAVIAQRMMNYSQEMDNNFYEEIINIRHPRAAERTDHLKDAAEKQRKMASRLIGREINYLKKSDQETALNLGAELYSLIIERIPIIAAAGDDPAAINELVNEYKEKNALQRAAIVAIHEAIEHEATTIGDHVISEIEALNRQIIVIFVIAIAVVVPTIIIIVLSITRPLRQVVADIQRMAGGDFSKEIQGKKRKDEIGGVVKALLDLQTYTSAKAKEEADREIERQNQAAAERKSMTERVADDFESQVGQVISILSAAVEELSASAQTLASSAETSTQQTASVAEQTESSNASVQNVAGATEELTASVKGVSEQVNKSAEIVQRAIDEADKTDRLVNELSESAAKIGEITELISQVADKTNLLALNATIEAARAGEAGKGFAVVAQEVKGLASQTAKATQSITEQIQKIQEMIQQAVVAIRQIGATIKEVGVVSGMIKTSMDQQDSATSEIARNVQEVANNSGRITNAIQTVSQAVKDTGSSSQEILSAIKELAAQSEGLNMTVKKFVQTVRGS